jgi:uncharacterized membrane protein
MYKDMPVKYLFINLKYPTYVSLQVTLIVGWMIAAGLFLAFGLGSDVWWIRNGWWLSLAAGCLEIIESLMAVNKAKTEYTAGGINV